MEIIQENLVQQYRDLVKSDFTIAYKKSVNHVAVIIEPRKHELLGPVIFNVFKNLRNSDPRIHWNLHVFGHSKNYVIQCLPNAKFKFTQLHVNNFTISELNSYIMSTKFWNDIEEENILFFQTDSFILNSMNTLAFNHVLKSHNFIGGVYWNVHEHHINLPSLQKSLILKTTNTSNSPKRQFSICGGFSFRKKSVMLDCLQKVSVKNLIEYRKQYKMSTLIFDHPTELLGEDLYFQNACELLGYRLPTLQECNRFCENFQNEKLNCFAFGIHNVKKREFNNLTNASYIAQLITDPSLLHLEQQKCSINNPLKPRKIVDGFIFDNELDMLEFRLEYLYNHIDHFILVESKHDSMGNPKKCVFKEQKNSPRFQKYTKKIVHVVLDNLSEQTIHLQNEVMQRNAIAQGFECCQLSTNDIILVSDVDEIPDRNTLEKVYFGDIEINSSNWYSLEQDHYYYSRYYRLPDKWHYSKLFTFKMYQDSQMALEEIRLSHLQTESTFKKIVHGGWHFSFFMQVNLIENKIKQFSHQKLNTNEVLENIENSIAMSKDLFNRKNTTLLVNEPNPYLPETVDQYKILNLYSPSTKIMKNTEARLCLNPGEVLLGWYGRDLSSFRTWIEKTILKNIHYDMCIEPESLEEVDCSSFSRIILIVDEDGSSSKPLCNFLTQCTTPVLLVHCRNEIQSADESLYYPLCEQVIRIGHPIDIESHNINFCMQLPFGGKIEKKLPIQNIKKNTEREFLWSTIQSQNKSVQEMISILNSTKPFHFDTSSEGLYNTIFVPIPTKMVSSVHLICSALEAGSIPICVDHTFGDSNILLSAFVQSWKPSLVCPIPFSQNNLEMQEIMVMNASNHVRLLGLQSRCLQWWQEVKKQMSSYIEDTGFLKNRKIMLCLLTSGQFDYFRASFESAVYQNMPKTYAYDIHVNVNTLNPNYFLEVKEYLMNFIALYNEYLRSRDIQVWIHKTTSNGKPGKGHNSVLELFRQFSNEYEYLFTVDGDDFLYPVALTQVEKYLLQHSPDVIMLMFHDILRPKQTNCFAYPVSNKVCLNFNIKEASRIFWEKTKSQLNPFEAKNINELNTYSRLIIFSRNAVSNRNRIHFDENCKLYDDFLPNLQVAELGLQQKLKVCRIYDSNIYVYNKLNEDSASATYNDLTFHTSENMHFQNSLHGKFTFLRKNFCLEKIPFYDLSLCQNFGMPEKISFIKWVVSLLNIQNFIPENKKLFKEFYKKVVEIKNELKIPVDDSVFKYIKMKAES